MEVNGLANIILITNLAIEDKELDLNIGNNLKIVSYNTIECLKEYRDLKLDCLFEQSITYLKDLIKILEFNSITTYIKSSLLKETKRTLRYLSLYYRAIKKSERIPEWWEIH